MAARLPLEKMSVEDKLQAMELIWSDLCARAGDMASPAWHGDVLQQRQTAIDQEEDQFQEWSAAKEQIRKEIS